MTVYGRCDEVSVFVSVAAEVIAGGEGPAITTVSRGLTLWRNLRRNDRPRLTDKIIKTATSSFRPVSAAMPNNDAGLISLYESEKTILNRRTLLRNNKLCHTLLICLQLLDILLLLRLQSQGLLMKKKFNQ